MRELKLVEPPDINSLYNGLLLEGEKFWSHDFRTLNEILDCLNVVKVTNRLPSCFWESIVWCFAKAGHLTTKFN